MIDLFQPNPPAEGVYHRQLDEAGKMPIATILPQAYEPRYPYPLLVCLHGHGARETQWLDAIPMLSRRNYIGISLRGPHPIQNRVGDPGFGWGRSRRCDSVIEDYVLGAIRETMRFCHVHSERIFLAGFCEGAVIAYRMGLWFPEKFAGVVAINGWLPDGPLPLGRNPMLRQLSTFIGHGTGNAAVPIESSSRAHDVLTAAGIPVCYRTYPTGHELSRPMLRDVDHWLMGLQQD